MAQESAFQSEEVSILKEARQAGITWRELASHMGLSRSRLYHLVKASESERARVRAAFAEILATMPERKPIPPTPTRRAADAFLCSLRAQGQPGSSYRVVGSCLNQLVAYVGDASLDRASSLVLDYMALRAGSLKPNSMHCQFSHLRQFFEYCFYEGLIERNPFARMKSPRRENVVTQPLSDAEISAILDHADSWERAMVILLLGSGMRIGELGAIRWSEIREGVLLLHGKGRKQRTVAPGAAAFRALMALPRVDERVFPFNYRPIEHKMEDLSRRSGVKFHPHQLRHSFAHRFLEATHGDIETLSAILGHSNLDTTATYLRAFRRERALAAQARYNPADAFFGAKPEPDPEPEAAEGRDPKIIPFRLRSA